MRPSLGKRSSFSHFSTAQQQPISPQQQRYPPGWNPYDEDPGAGSSGPHTAAKASRYSASAVPGESYMWDQSAPQASSYAPSSTGMKYAPSDYQLPRRSAYFESTMPLYSVSWSTPAADGVSCLAVGTCNDESKNKIQVVHTEGNSFNLAAEASVPYPCTKLAWDSRLDAQGKRQFATSGDCLRIWSYDSSKGFLQQRCSLSNSKSGSISPITSFDWNKVAPHLIITSSIDTTCTLWDLNTSSARTQLIAHDQEVYDVQFTAGSTDVFASVGADGSVRVFDLRALDHSTIIYDPPKPPPLVRIAGCPYDGNILATFAGNSSKVLILDIRQPGMPIDVLQHHQAPVNAIQWCPQSVVMGGQRKRLLASSSDDSQIILWNTAVPGDYHLDSAFTDSAEVNNICWSASGDWIASVTNKGVQGVRLS